LIIKELPTRERMKRIEIAQMNRTIKQMQNKINNMRRGDNYMPNPRMTMPKQRRNPPPENRVRFENTDDPQRPRFPR
jgi:hypothetical protein